MMNQKYMERFFKSATFAVFMLSVFLVFLSMNEFKDWRATTAANNTISVSGEGDAFVTPDVATFSFGVSADAAQVSDAQTNVTTKTNAIISALKQLGIADADIQTSDYSIYPKYTYTSTICQTNGICPPSQQVPDGYTVSNSLTVKVRNTDDAGKALAAVGDNGGTNVSGLSFTLDNPEAPQAEAQAKAIADAKAKALVLAKDLGVSLGQVVTFTDDSNSGQPMPIFMNALSAGATSAPSAPTISTGQNKVSDNVTITYEIR
jgi:uncharacterized protein YggE